MSAATTRGLVAASSPPIAPRGMIHMAGSPPLSADIDGSHAQYSPVSLAAKTVIAEGNGSVTLPSLNRLP